MDAAAFVLISLRPANAHAVLRRAAARHGGRLLAISPWRIVPHDDAASRRGLAAALACPTLVFTSPNAVRAADALHPLRSISGKTWLAVGEGSRRALADTGITQALAPPRMDSEGLLAMPQLTGLVAGDRVGLVTAPGGRGEIVRQLSARGIELLRANVYSREPLRLSGRAIAGLHEVLRSPPGAPVLALTSAEALAWLLAELPDALSIQLKHQASVIAASARLAALAKHAGFARIRQAASARPADLIAAMIDGGQ
ncbi:MAG: uroporphyrinogen-III synthase [Pseudomonadota bacterium]|nr:uroporphyrinogen-III synthase [Pseudomonadota bacterium]